MAETRLQGVFHFTMTKQEIAETWQLDISVFTYIKYYLTL